MREFIKTLEFTGKLDIEGKTFQENVKCIYKDDYYSNRTMKGEFFLNYLSAEFLNKFKGRSKFIFEDISGRILKGIIYGFNEKSEYNERWSILNFNVDEYEQRLLFSNVKPKILKIEYFVPYVSLLSRDLRYSYGFDESYLLKYISPVKTFCVNEICIQFDDRSYLINDVEPDSKFVREIHPVITIKDFNYDNIYEVLEEYKLFIKDLFIIISFILNHRVFSYGYKAKLLDENEKLTEFITRKYKFGMGYEFINERYDHEFEKFFTMSNLASLFGNYRLIDKKEDFLERILYSYISIGEQSLFESTFLSAFSTLEGISKLIVNPTNNISSEDLIKQAIIISGIDLKENEFEISKSRLKKDDSKLEWLITEYRNYRIHFNQEEFDTSVIASELKKIMKLTRMLIFYYVEPGLINWPEP